MKRLLLSLLAIASASGQSLTNTWLDGLDASHARPNLDAIGVYTSSNPPGWSVITGKPAFGTASLADVSAFATAVHTHAASDITSGTLPDARIASAATWNAKQSALISGTSIKTINGASLLGSGDIAVATTAQGAKADTALQPSVAATTYAPISHTQAWSTITSTPTTLSGYGISDGLTAATAASTYVTLSGDQTIAGNKTFSGQIELTGQAATYGTSPITRDLGDGRYAIQSAYLKFTTTTGPTGAIDDGSGSGWKQWRYTIPTAAKTIRIYAIGGGGGGGSGRRGASGTARFGGGAGAGGPKSYLELNCADLASRTLYIRVGLGGVGGASVTTDNTDGNNGGLGNPSDVSTGGYNSTILLAAAINQAGSSVGASPGIGIGGAGGTSTSGAGQSAGATNYSTWQATSGSTSSAVGVPTANNCSNGAGTGGTAGGGISTGDISYAGGTTYGGAGVGGAAGTSTTAGTAGTTPTKPGCGGGGGGASFNGYASGAGGAGAPGQVEIFVQY